MAITISGTTGIAGVDGSAGTPAVQGTDTNTGVFYPAADTVGVSTGGSERVRVDSSGNVGIGTSSPSYKLDVISSVRFGDGTGQVIARINGANSGTNNGAAVYFQNAGTTNFAVGNYSAIAGGAYSADALYYLGNANNHIWFVSGSEKMRIDSSGNLLLNTTTVRNTAKFTIDYNGASAQGIVLNNTDTGSASQLAMQFYRGATPSVVGQITTTNAATAYVTSSDYRLKENITPMTGALAKVSALKPVTYKWKIDGSNSDGFIAHELAEVCPQAVYGEKDDVNEDGSIKPQGIDTSFLVATLTAAIQELKGLVDTQASTITALTAQIEALETK